MDSQILEIAKTVEHLQPKPTWELTKIEQKGLLLAVIVSKDNEDLISNRHIIWCKHIEVDFKGQKELNEFQSACLLLARSISEYCKKKKIEITHLWDVTLKAELKEGKVVFNTATKRVKADNRQHAIRLVCEQLDKQGWIMKEVISVVGIQDGQNQASEKT